MLVKKIKVLEGPNYWSIKRTHLIQMTLDIGKYEEIPTDKIPGFAHNLVSLIPSLKTHRCSEEQEGGFIYRMQKGTWLGHVVEHVALEIQTLAGMDCGYGRTRSTGNYGEYNVVFSYTVRSAGLYAAKSAVEIVKYLIKGLSFDIDSCLVKLRAKSSKKALGPSTQSIVDAAIKRGIPFTRLNKESYVMFGYGKNQRRIQATIADSTSVIAVELVQDKHKIKELLSKNNIPVPEGMVVKKKRKIKLLIEKLSYPVVIKPKSGNHGRGVVTNIFNLDNAILAFEMASTISKEIIIEKYIAGNDYRFLIVNYKVIAVSKRSAASVIGDGKSTIGQLIEIENRNPKRGQNHENYLTKISIDNHLISYLRANNLTTESILVKDVVQAVKHTANLSSGGTAEDVTDVVPRNTKLLMERAARLVGLDICGIDVIMSDIKLPFLTGGGYVLEINAAPGFRMHLEPSFGQGRNVGDDVISMLFPNNKPSRIPIVGVTGTNGKTTTARLLSHIASKTNLNVGCITTEGIYIDGECVNFGDCSGPASAKSILSDPLIDYAVLECARGGILRAGLGFDICDISIVTNLSEDHLGDDGITTMEQMARVKQVLPEVTSPHGVVVLNADDDYVYEMRHSTKARLALFSLSKDNPHIISHIKNNGLVAYVDNDCIHIVKACEVIESIAVNEIPISMGGNYDCMIQNSMAAVLAAISSGFSLKNIILGLQTFLPSPEMNIGRMNKFVIDDVDVIVDYVHNIQGYKELKKYLSKVNAISKIGIITGTGNRRSQDIIEIGRLSSEIFDTIIIRHDEDCRGRSKSEITELLLEGIKSVYKHKVVEVISNEQEALQVAIKSSPSGGLVFLSSDDSRKSIQYVENIKNSHFDKLKFYGT